MFNLKTRVTDKDIISDELFTTLKKFQEENRDYLKDWKERELKDHVRLSEYYNEQNHRNEIKRKWHI